VIEGWFLRRSGYFNAVVEAGLWIPTITPEPKIVDFVIDTGADRTTLQPVDARNVFDLPLELLENERAWASVTTVSGISQPATCYVVPARVVFQHVDGRTQDVALRLYVMKPTQHNRTLPSLLGWDVLRRFELRLNWNRLTVFLLRPEEA